jgi:antitoxin component of MazEF toxin-antitoxin module
MNKSWSLALLALALASSIPLKAHAQENQLRVTQDKQYKVKVKGDKVIVRDKSKPVRRALEEQYAKIAEANKNKDLAALLALRAPDFSAKLPNGETWNYEQLAAYSRLAFEQVQSIISLSNTIETLTITGKEAVAVVHQQWSRMQMKKGELRRVDTSAVQRETWVNAPDGWRLKLVDDVHPGAWFVDGKRVDPSKPYDPDAPPYHP